jgi:DNA repair exonuclease SbcCD ATPase subunit
LVAKENTMLNQTLALVREKKAQLEEIEGSIAYYTDVYNEIEESRAKLEEKLEALEREKAELDAVFNQLDDVVSGASQDEEEVSYDEGSFAGEDDDEDTWGGYEPLPTVTSPTRLSILRYFRRSKGHVLWLDSVHHHMQKKQTRIQTSAMLRSLKKTGLVSSVERGSFRLTDLGEDVLKKADSERSTPINRKAEKAAAQKEKILKMPNPYRKGHWRYKVWERVRYWKSPWDFNRLWDTVQNFMDYDELPTANAVDHFIRDLLEKVYVRRSEDNEDFYITLYN